MLFKSISFSSSPLSIRIAVLICAGLLIQNAAFVTAVSVENVVPAVESTKATAGKNLSSTSGTEGELKGETKPNFLSSCDGKDKLYETYCDLYRSVSAVLAKLKQDPVTTKEFNSTQLHESSGSELCTNLLTALENAKQKQKIIVNESIMKELVCQQKCFTLDERGNAHTRQLCPELLQKLLQLHSKPMPVTSQSPQKVTSKPSAAQKDAKKQNKKHLKGETRKNSEVKTAVTSAEPTATAKNISTTSGTESKLQDKAEQNTLGVTSASPTIPNNVVQKVKPKTSAAQKDTKVRNEKHQKGETRGNADDKAVIAGTAPAMTVRNISTTSETERNKAEQSILSSCDGKDVLYEKYCDLYRNVSVAFARLKEDPVTTEKFNNMQRNVTSESEFCKNLVNALKAIKPEERGIVVDQGIVKEIACEQQCFLIETDGTVHRQKLCQELLRKLDQLGSQPVKVALQSPLPLKTTVQKAARQEDVKKQTKKHRVEEVTGNVGVVGAEPAVTVRNISTTSATEGKQLNKAKPRFLSNCDGKDKLYETYCGLYHNVSAVLIKRKQEPIPDEEFDSTQIHAPSEFEFCLKLYNALKAVQHKKEGIIVNHRLLKQFVCQKKCFWIDGDGKTHQHQVCWELLRGLTILNSEPVKVISSSPLPLKMQKVTPKTTPAQNKTERRKETSSQGKPKDIAEVKTVVPAAEPTTTTTHGTKDKLQDKTKLNLPSSCGGKDNLLEKYCDLYQHLSAALSKRKDITMMKQFNSAQLDTTGFCNDLTKVLKAVNKTQKGILVDRSLLSEHVCEHKCILVDDDGSSHLQTLCQELLRGFRRLLDLNSKGISASSKTSITEEYTDEQSDKRVEEDDDDEDNTDAPFDDRYLSARDSDESFYEPSFVTTSKTFETKNLPLKVKVIQPKPAEDSYSYSSEVQRKELLEETSLKQSDSIYFAFCVFTMFACILWYIVRHTKSKPGKYA